MLENILREFGYNDTDIIMIKYNKKLSKYTELELSVMIKDIYIYLLNLGYSREEVIKMTSNCSSIFALSKVDIDNRIKFLLGFGYKEEDVYKIIKNNSSVLVLDEKQISDVIDILCGFGNKKEEVLDMTLNYSGIYNLYDSLEDKFNGLVSLGIDDETVNLITKKTPSIYGFRYDEFINKIKYLKEIGFSSLTILKLVKECELLNIIMLDNLKSKIREFDILGFSVNDLDKMILVYPNVFILNISDILEKVQCFGSYGFYYSNSCNMIKENANILKHSNEMIRDIMDVFILYGYSCEEVNELVLKNPNIFDINFLDLVRKLEFLGSVRLSKKVISNPKILFGNIEDMYSRYMYLTSNGVRVNSKNSNILFVSNDKFLNKYNVNYEEVIDNYKNNKLLSGYSLRKIKKN